MNDFTGASGTTYGGSSSAQQPVQSVQPVQTGSGDPRDRLAAGNPSAGGSRDIIGADGVYVPPGPGGGLAPFVYGDAQRLIKDNFSPSQIASLQEVLSEAGMLGRYVRGQRNNDLYNAYEQVLQMSNEEGRAPSAIVSSLSAANWARRLGASVGLAGDRVVNGPPGGGGPSRAPFTARVSNPNDLKRYFREAVINATGEFKGQVDIDKMVEAYQSVERNAQAAAYNAEPSGGTVEAAMSPDAFVEDALAEAVPDEVQTRNVVDRAGQLFDMLGGPFGEQ